MRSAPFSRWRRWRRSRARGVSLHTDAVQAVGQLEVDFWAGGVAALSVTGHKLGGPGGVGALLLGREVECTPLVHGGDQERDVRSGTLDVAGVLAFAVAVELAVKASRRRAASSSARRADGPGAHRCRTPSTTETRSSAAGQRPLLLPRL